MDGQWLNLPDENHFKYAMDTDHECFGCVHAHEMHNQENQRRCTKAELTRQGATPMIELNTLEDYRILAESYDLECKKAGGKDGKGELPKDFWESYSVIVYRRRNDLAGN